MRMIFLLFFPAMLITMYVAIYAYHVGSLKGHNSISSYLVYTVVVRTGSMYQWFGTKAHE